MDKKKVLEIGKDCENKSNKDLFEANDILVEEFKKTKELIISLTRHLDSIESLHKKISSEISKRKGL